MVTTALTSMTVLAEMGVAWELNARAIRPGPTFKDRVAPDYLAKTFAMFIGVMASDMRSRHLITGLLGLGLRELVRDANAVIKKETQGYVEDPFLDNRGLHSFRMVLNTNFLVSQHPKESYVTFHNWVCT